MTDRRKTALDAQKADVMTKFRAGKLTAAQALNLISHITFCSMTDDEFISFVRQFEREFEVRKRSKRS